MKKILSAFFVVVCLLITIITLSYQRTIVKKSGTYEISGLSSPVNVHFDEYGIPHIEGQNAKDTFKVLGFIIASERLFQLDLLRRVVNGSLSEIFGKATISIDELSRKLKFKRHSNLVLETQASNISKEIDEKMQAFIDGIHEYIETQPLPVEFTLLNYKPGPFEKGELLGVSMYMALGFAEGLTADVLFSELMEKLPREKMELLRIGDTVDDLYFLEKKTVRTKIIDQIQNTIEQVGDYVPLFHGSNAWVLSGKRTKNGFPILANDPHIKMANPHIFYEAHIKYPGFELYGHYIPLSPFPVLGHTPYSAWGLTMAEVDDITIYEEKFNPEDPNQVMFKNEWVNVNSWTEIIKVKNSDDVTVKITETPHGVLLDDTKFGVDGKNLAFTWSAHLDDNNLVKSFHDLGFAKTIEEFRDAISHGAAPPLNVMWVNKTGDIAWWTLGRYPKLPEGVPYDVVLNGWDGTHEIERYYNIDENPHKVNPESGIIVSANHRPEYEEFKHFDGYWQPAGRFYRLKELLGKKEKWDIHELKDIQTDNIVPEVNVFLAQMRKGLNVSDLTEYEKDVWNVLDNWDGSTGKESIGSSIFHMSSYYIAMNVFKDELGEKDIRRFARSADHWHAFKKVLLDLNHTFWDNVSTNRVESGEEVLTNSFKQAVSELKSRLGHRYDLWHWEKLHRITYQHTLGKKWPLNYIYNVGPIPAPGARFVVNNLGHAKMTDDFSITSGPATRRIIDMKNTRESYGIIPLGNSGNPFSEHFNDQAPIYLQDKYRLQTMDWESIQKLPLLKFK